MSTTAVVALVIFRGDRSGDAGTRERDAARQAGCDVLHILPHGVLVRGTEPQLAQLAERDFRVETFPDTDVVQAGRFRWRVDEASPVLEPEWDIPPNQAATWRHQLVQFIAPPIPEWIKEVEARGAIAIDNSGPYGLLISASPTDVDRLAALRFVTFIGPCRPAYRVAPTLDERQGRIQFVSIWVNPKHAGPAVTAAVERFGGRVARTSTQGQYAWIVAELDADKVKQVAQLPDVSSLSYLNPEIEPTDERACQILSAQATSSPGYLKWLSDHDLTGKDVTIAFADSGISPHGDLAPNGVGTGRYVAAVKFTQPSSTVAATDALGHGTYVAGIAVGDGTGTDETDPAGFLLGQGIAPGANFVSLKLARDDSPLTWENADQLETWTAQAVALGASLMNNSWQTPATQYDDVARTVDTAVRVDSLTMVVGAGNKKQSSTTVTVPGLSKNAITVGATESGRNGNIVDQIWSGSRVGPVGPRILPTVVAPGMIIVSTRAKCGAPFVDSGGTMHNEHALGSFPIDGTLACVQTGGAINLSGTSWAVPHVSGACALLSQAWANQHGSRPSPALLKAWIINGADDVGPALCQTSAHTFGTPGCLHAPNKTMGWGRVNLHNMLSDARGPRLFFDEPMTFVSPGEVFTQRVSAGKAGLPIRVTLVWTDPPGSMSNPGIIHDLNLEVQADNGPRYLGNVNFAGGFNAPVGAGTQPDHGNNVECVYVQNPVGIYTVRVFAPPAFSVTFPSQTFALVIENAQLAAPVAPRITPPSTPTGVRIIR